MLNNLIEWFLELSFGEQLAAISFILTLIGLYIKRRKDKKADARDNQRNKHLEALAQQSEITTRQLLKTGKQLRIYGILAITSIIIAIIVVLRPYYNDIAFIANDSVHTDIKPIHNTPVSIIENDSMPIEHNANIDNTIHKLDDINKIYKELAITDTAISYFKQAAELSRYLGDKPSEAKWLTHIGSIYENMEDYPTALNYYTQALNLANQYNHTESKKTYLNNVNRIKSKIEHDATLNKNNIPLDSLQQDSISFNTLTHDSTHVHKSTKDSSHYLRDSLRNKND